MYWFIYSIEMFDPTTNKWIEEIRYYMIEKNLNDFDLYNIPNKRRNVKLIGSSVKIFI